MTHHRLTRVQRWRYAATIAPVALVLAIALPVTATPTESPLPTPTPRPTPTPPCAGRARGQRSEAMPTDADTFIAAHGGHAYEALKVALSWYDTANARASEAAGRATAWHKEYDNLCKFANDYERRANAAEGRVEALEAACRRALDWCRRGNYERAAWELGEVVGEDES